LVLPVHDAAAPDPHDHVAQLLLGVLLDLRRRLDVGVARVAVARLDGRQVLDELGAVEPLARARAQHLAELAPPAERLDLAAVVVDPITCRRRTL
jgi:hypothetical protein